jgi:V/A-type H+-transporting ATPase subunit F
MNSGTRDQLGFFCLGDDLTRLSFALVGIPGETPADARETRRLLKRARNDKQVGIILITERLAREVQEDITRLREQDYLPIILEIPEFSGPLPSRLSQWEQVQRWLGLPVRSTP